MALEGSLRDFDLFSLFNMIKIQGKNGTLVLSRGSEFVKVFFENGEIVGCDSNQVRMEDRVGTMLVRLGRLTGDELLEMIQKQRQTLKRMGTLLIESGKVSPQDLQDALFSQATAILHRTFRWVSGDYRFDSFLPEDLERENFPPIPVDTVLMEAARIQDEWPEVERRLPPFSTPIAKTVRGAGMQLDINRDLAGVLEGKNQAAHAASGLNHEQEMVLSYFDTPQSIDEVCQISRYEELDTCKTIVSLLQLGLLQVAKEEAPKVVRPWVAETGDQPLMEEPEGMSPVFWPLLAAALLIPVLTYVPHRRGSLNVGLASLQPADVQVVPDGPTRTLQDWAFRMAAPHDGGKALADELGRPMNGPNPVPDLAKRPDPLGPAPAPELRPAPAGTGKTR
ncbi:MAG TPA: DUF4388 domain-containing protein [Holophagaceae bacterium]|nr:DUF4388 domain-containing protein [Holophagaceae bacterium]